MTGAAIKGLGRWGSQSGLLSSRELDELMRVVRLEAARYLTFDMLEVGHYYGLSTMALVTALRSSGNPRWSLVTIDSHEADAWVPATSPEEFTRNRVERFDDLRLVARFMRSQNLTDLGSCYDAVFYDGDHGEEQRRFTQLVIDSDGVDLFIFDDRDFPVPSACCALLREAGWLDESPPLVRGPEDKSGATAMTLGIYRRPTFHERTHYPIEQARYVRGPILRADRP